MRAAVYSHHHIDHVFGTRRFEAEAAERGWPGAGRLRPRGGARTNFRRYERTLGWNTAINKRQFALPVDTVRVAGDATATRTSRTATT